MNVQSSSKKISYLIVTWNNADIIEECIDTLFAYSPFENEVIVVDNCSPDNTMQVVRDRYGDKVKLIDAGDNLGFAKANNLALQHATGEYICYTNPDVIFIEDILTPMVKVLEEQPEIGVVSPMLLYKDKSYLGRSADVPSAAGKQAGKACSGPVPQGR